MLNRLIIRNYALIDDLDISFSDELNIITGETGAGKSIILGALSLILGQRIESKYFFNQQKKCIIEGFFKISEYNIKSFFDDNDIDYEDETVLRREISADGKSRAFVNDSPVNLTLLKQLGEKLIDIHSQHATLEINNPEFQLLVVDSLAGNNILLSQYQQFYKSYKQKTAQLLELISVSQQAKNDTDYYKFQFDELEKANLTSNEQTLLEEELESLTHAEEIKRSLLNTSLLINDQEQSVLILLKEALLQLQHAEKFRPEISELSERLKSTIIEIKDIEAEASTIEQKVQINEARTVEVNDRLNIIYSLQKKHRVSSVAELQEIRESISNRLSSIFSSDQDIVRLKEEIGHLKNEMIVLSDTLSAGRNEAIPDIENRIKLLLTELGMPNAVLKINNVLLPEDHFNIHGRNEIEFLFSANKGQQPAPMNKVASGGELSRLMLTIKSLIASHTSLPTIIFDEIDTGISGEVALKVGNVLDKLSSNLQVIAITHLPQIAAKGNAHYRVYKDEQEDRTLTNIALLSSLDRVTEIAQMLSGENPGEFALQHAKELLHS